MDSQKEKFITATKELVGTVTKVVENVKKRFSQMGAGPQFTMMAAKGLRNMVNPIWTGYWKYLDAVRVNTKQEVEELQKSFGDDKDVLKCVEELHAAEAQFGGLAAQLNAVIQKEEDKVMP